MSASDSPAAAPVGYQKDIYPLFTDRDVGGMAWDFDLRSYADVKAHALAIQDRIQGIGGRVMPPPPPKGDGPWSAEWIALFKQWVADGCQP